MKCQNCNSELLEGAKFCTTCGTPVAAQPAGG
ncbi:zinc-ribbon domain-containing protein, partial [Alistipes finegoldii]